MDVASRSRGPSASPALIGDVSGGVEEMTPAPASRLSTDSIRKTSPRVSVVVPALNEAENLPHVLPRIAPEYELVLVDRGSVDATVEVARQLRPDVRVVTQDRRGKGNALACGFAAATGEVIVMLDADGSARPEEIPQFVDILCRGADFAKGSRSLAGGGSADITRFRRFGNWLLGALVNLLFRTRYTDLCYGYNAFWSRWLPALEVDCDGFEVETLMHLRAAKAGLVVVEVPSYEDARLFGASNLRAIPDGLRVLRTILVERLRRPGESDAEIARDLAEMARDLSPKVTNGRALR
jgi:glycosyltransferase involved in cell wall biosynthesis